MKTNSRRTWQPKEGVSSLCTVYIPLSIARRSNSVEIKHSIELEAMWIRFRSRDKFPIKVFAGGVNAVSGEPMLGNAATTFHGLNRKSQGKILQDYLMTPQQL